MKRLFPILLLALPVHAQPRSDVEISFDEQADSRCAGVKAEWIAELRGRIPDFRATWESVGPDMSKAVTQLWLSSASRPKRHAGGGRSAQTLGNATTSSASRSSSMTADTRFLQAASALGYSFDGELKIGGNYVPLVSDGNVLYVSGQVPRVGSTIVVTGRVGSNVTLSQAQLAAKVCAMRALALLQRELGSLDNVRQVLRVTVYTQSSEEFTQQSEVADGASELLHAVLGEAGKHTRTSVGVYQLPKNASVELDLVASAKV